MFELTEPLATQHTCDEVLDTLSKIPNASFKLPMLVKTQGSGGTVLMVVMGTEEVCNESLIDTLREHRWASASVLVVKDSQYTVKE